MFLTTNNAKLGERVRMNANKARIYYAANGTRQMNEAKAHRISLLFSLCMTRRQELFLKIPSKVYLRSLFIQKYCFEFLKMHR